jgi:hypothetical protein
VVPQLFVGKIQNRVMSNDLERMNVELGDKSTSLGTTRKQAETAGRVKSAKSAVCAERRIPIMPSTSRQSGKSLPAVELLVVIDRPIAE